MNAVVLSGHAFHVSPRVQQLAEQLFGRVGPTSHADHRVSVVVERTTPREVAVTAQVHDVAGGAMTVRGTAQNVYAALRAAARHARTCSARRRRNRH